jgi:hypothetical protein
MLDLEAPLFHFADSTAAWYRSATWHPRSGAAQTIPEADLRVVSPWQVEVANAAGLRSGRGVLEYSFNVVEIEGMGLSFPTENLVTVASENFDGTPVSDDTMRATVVH